MPHFSWPWRAEIGLQRVERFEADDAGERPAGFRRPCRKTRQPVSDRNRRCRTENVQTLAQRQFAGSRADFGAEALRQRAVLGGDLRLAPILEVLGEGFVDRDIPRIDFIASSASKNSSVT